MKSIALLGAALVSSVSGTDVVSYDTVQDLRSSVPLPVSVVAVAAHTTPGDSGGGMFSWSSKSTENDDNGSVIKPSSTPPSQQGRWIRQVAVGSLARPEFFGARSNDSDLDCAPAFQSALDAYGGVFAGPGEYFFRSSVILGSGQRIEGASADLTNLTLADGANCDLIQSTNFTNFHGKAEWFTYEGVPTGFMIRNIALVGNAAFLPEKAGTGAGNTQGSGLRLYAKRYILENVLSYGFADYCIYTECGQVTGQRTMRDMPESSIGPLWVKDCGIANLAFYGAHDSMVNYVLSAGGNGDGVQFGEIHDVVTGESDVGFIHAYAARGAGVNISTVVQAKYIISESNRGPALLANARNLFIGMLKVFENQPPPYEDSTATAVIDIQQGPAIIGMAEISGNYGGPVLRVGGKMTSIQQLRLQGDGSTGPGIVVQANQARIGGFVGGFTGNGSAVREGSVTPGERSFGASGGFLRGRGAHGSWPQAPPLPHMMVRDAENRFSNAYHQIQRGVGPSDTDEWVNGAARATNTDGAMGPTACVAFERLLDDAGTPTGPLPNMLSVDLDLEECGEYVSANGTGGAAIIASKLAFNAYGANATAVDSGLLVGGQAAFAGDDTSLYAIGRAAGGHRRRTRTGVVLLPPQRLDQGELQANVTGLDLLFEPAPGQCTASVAAVNWDEGLEQQDPKITTPLVLPLPGVSPRDGLQVRASRSLGIHGDVQFSLQCDVGMHVQVVS